MRCRIVTVSLLMGVMLAAKAEAGTHTNQPASAVSSSPVKFGAIVFQGGDGSSIERAVLIKNAKGEEDGVAAESHWVRTVHPGWRKGDQALLSDKGRSYDRIEYRTPNGETKTLYFDITEFFGK